MKTEVTFNDMNHTKHIEKILEESLQDSNISPEEKKNTEEILKIHDNFKKLFEKMEEMLDKDPRGK